MDERLEYRISYPAHDDDSWSQDTESGPLFSLDEVGKDIHRHTHYLPQAVRTRYLERIRVYSRPVGRWSEVAAVQQLATRGEQRVEMEDARKQELAAQQALATAQARVAQANR